MKNHIWVVEWRVKANLFLAPWSIYIISRTRKTARDHKPKSIIGASTEYRIVKYTPEVK